MNDKPKKIKDKKKPLVPAVRQKSALVPPDPFAAYLQEAKKYPILTEEEEKELVGSFCLWFGGGAAGSCC